jgi:hypothetical protein
LIPAVDSFERIAFTSERAFDQVGVSGLGRSTRNHLQVIDANGKVPDRIEVEEMNGLPWIRVSPPYSIEYGAALE